MNISTPNIINIPADNPLVDPIYIKETIYYLKKINMILLEITPYLLVYSAMELH